MGVVVFGLRLDLLRQIQYYVSRQEPKTGASESVEYHQNVKIESDAFGSGNFGSVFRGKLGEKEVCLKALKSGDDVAEKELKEEMSLLLVCLKKCPHVVRV